MKYVKPLDICADMYGCPNRCLHCWLGHMPNRAMEHGADEWIVDRFKPFFEAIGFYSWLREPDFCADYREQWERDKRISVNTEPLRFELASFWRLVRDPDYVHFLKEAGVKCVQLTFFGMERATDKYVGRKGAFSELIKATELLLENGLLPRWQAFINEENRFEIVELMHYAEELRLVQRAREIGGEFRFFTHPGSCDGENRLLYPIRIHKDHIPSELVHCYWKYDTTSTESELYHKLHSSTEHFVPSNKDEETIVIYVSNEYDLFFNFTHMKPEWRIGNLKSDPIEELVRRITEEDIPALHEARSITIGELVVKYGDEASPRAFDEDDYLTYLLNKHLEHTFPYDYGVKN